MKEQSIYKKALRLAIPMMIQNGIANIVSLVDNLMVGGLGTEQITAVAIAGQLMFVFNLAVFGGLSGPGIYGAQYYGQGNTDGFRNVFRLKWLISMAIVCVGIIVFSLVGDHLLLLYLQGEEAGINAALTLSLAKQYLMIMLVGLVPFGITQVYAGSLRETGESVKPMVAGIASVLTDVAFNAVLINGWCGFPRLEVRGAAIATVIARFVEMGIVVIWAHSDQIKHTFLQGIYKTMRIPMDLAKTMIVKGLPIFFNEFLWAAGIAKMTQCYSTRGLPIVAGTNIANALCNLLNVVFIAMGNAVGILTGQMLGASEFDQAKKNSLRLMKFTGVVCAFLTVFLISVSGIFPEFYDTSAEVKNYATKFIIITALFFPVQGYLNALYFTLRSGGKTLVTFLFDSVYTWVLPVPIAFVLCKYTSMSIYTIFVIIQAADIIKIIIGYCLIRKGVWITNLVEEKNEFHAG